MPYSTGSDDSGVGLRIVDYSSCCFDLSAPTSSLTCSEDEFLLRWPLPSKGRSSRGGKGRNKKRKQQKLLLQRPTSVPNSLSTGSTCSSEDSFLEEVFGSDVVQVYFHFQQLLVSLREQQKSFQNMAKIMGDLDARWGAGGYKNGWRIDPAGSLAPAPSEGFWSYPHPAVYLALMANYIQEYLHFLRCVYPQVGVLAHGSNISRMYLGQEDLPELLPPSKQQHHQRRGQKSETPLSLLAASESPAVDGKSDLPLSPPNAPPSPPPSEPVDHSGQFEISKMDVLSEQIWHFHNKITQRESTLTRKLSLRDMLYYAISPIFPMCGLYVVGSSLNGFGNDKSDMDLCLMITNKDLDQKTDAVVVLNMISSALQKMDWVATQKLILAKVPILRIKFQEPFDDITVDLNANNSVAIKNTHLLCYYSSFDWRVRPLVSIVKEWAKKKGINDANRSSFTSYSLVLMVIHYLQCGVQPPILPSLQAKYPKRFHHRLDVRTLSVTQPLNIEGDWTYHDKATLGELLIGFLKYFSSKFDYDAQAISVREGKLISRTQVTRSNGHSESRSVTWRSQWRCICIEEPFTYNNTAHSIYDEMVFSAIKKAFEEAHDELDRTRDINRLLACTPITVVPPNNGATAYVYNGIGGGDSSPR